MNVECKYFRKEKNIVEIFGSNKERGNYVKMEKKKNCILMKSFIACTLQI
jgi:hypothetical protein